MHPSCLRKWDRDSCQEPASKAHTGWVPYPCCLPFIKPPSYSCVFLPCYHSTFCAFSLSASLLSLRFPAFCLTPGSAVEPIFDVAGWLVAAGLHLPSPDCVSGTLLSRSFSAARGTLGSMRLSSNPFIALSSQGLWAKLFLKGGHGRLVEPCLLGDFPRSLYLWLFIFSIFMWLLLWVHCWHSENSLMPAILLLSGTQSPPTVCPDNVVGARPVKSCPHLLCSMGYASVFVHWKILHISKQKD